MPEVSPVSSASAPDLEVAASLAVGGCVFKVSASAGDFDARFAGAPSVPEMPFVVPGSAPGLEVATDPSPMAE